METAIKVIGLLFIVMGALVMARPDLVRKMLSFFSHGIRIYIAGVIRFAFGVIYLLAAMESDITWIITVMGVLFLAGGLTIFILGPEKSRKIINWYSARRDFIIRASGILVIFLGSATLYAA